MVKNKQEDKKLKSILDSNHDLHQRMYDEEWSVKYRKSSDMLVMGAAFPEGSFYHYVNGTGVMVRVDENQKIYGFAIENIKSFIKENPEVGFMFYPIVYPYRFLFRILIYRIWRNIDELKKISAVSDYIAGRASLA